MNYNMVDASQLILEDCFSDKPYPLERFEELLIELKNINFIYDESSKYTESVLRLYFEKPKHVSLLLEYGIDLNAFIEKQPIIHHLLQSRQEAYMGEDFYSNTKESIRLILNACTPEILNQIDDEGRTALDIVISSQAPFEIQDLIIKNGGIAKKNERLFLSKRYQDKLKKRLKAC